MWQIASLSHRDAFGRRLVRNDWKRIVIARNEMTKQSLEM
jgi:hypothetical protein